MQPIQKKQLKLHYAVISIPETGLWPDHIGTLPSQQPALYEASVQWNEPRLLFYKALAAVHQAQRHSLHYTTTIRHYAVNSLLTCNLLCCTTELHSPVVKPSFNNQKITNILMNYY